MMISERRVHLLSKLISPMACCALVWCACSRFFDAGEVSAQSIGTGSAVGNRLSPALQERCIKASVMVRVPVGTGGSSGSGSILHQDGYVLTNFHVVGHMTPRGGKMPGTLYREDGMVEIWHTDASRTEATFKYKGRVVRGDVAADLALIRIESLPDGSALPPGTRFTTIPISRSPADLSDRVYAYGFPAGILSITGTGGQVSGFTMDAENNVAYIRVDAEFNHGNSGGMLVDSRGALVGIPTLVMKDNDQISPIEMARPAERISRNWLSEMARGIDDVVIAGTYKLETTLEMTSAGTGLVRDDHEVFFVELPKRDGEIRFTIAASEPDVEADAALMTIERRGQPVATVRDNKLMLVIAEAPNPYLMVVMGRRLKDGSFARPVHMKLEFHASVAIMGALASSGPSPFGGQPIIVIPPSGSSGVQQPGGLGLRGAAPGTMPVYATQSNSQQQSENWEPKPSTLFFQLGVITDTTKGFDSIGGADVRLQYLFAFRGGQLDPMLFSFDLGVSLGIGSWRKEMAFAANIPAGFRLSVGAPAFAVEALLHYLPGLVMAEKETLFTFLGYQAGVLLRFRDFSIGGLWSEQKRDAFSTYREVNLTLGFDF